MERTLVGGRASRGRSWLARYILRLHCLSSTRVLIQTIQVQCSWRDGFPTKCTMFLGLMRQEGRPGGKASSRATVGRRCHRTVQRSHGWKRLFCQTRMVRRICGVAWEVVMRSDAMCLLFIFVLAGCATSFSREHAVYDQGMAKIYRPKIAAYTDRTDSQVRDLAGAFESLNIGDSAADVERKLGSPNDFGMGGPKDVWALPTFVWWDYRFARPSGRPINPALDRYVSLGFTVDNRLKTIHSNGVPGVRNRPEAAREPSTLSR